MHKKKIVSCLSAAILFLAQTPAYSAGLGKLSINSALGQPLNAEIEVIATDPTELSSMQARLASADAYRSANIEMTNALSSIKLVVDKKPDGRAVLKITTSSPINDPFVDMLIELNWGSGQMLREYTLLLDPPGMFNNKTLTVTPANTKDTVAPPKPVAAENATTKEKPPARESRVNVVKPSHKKPAISKPTPPAPASETENAPVMTAKPRTETIGPVKRGATLSSIAKETKPEGVNLEQMLVGLYRQNEQAFDGNMNRLKTGKILKVPTKDEVAAITPEEAAREIRLQAADWHSYRQKLAGEVEAAPKAAEKQAETSGKITPKVEDKAATAKPGQDVLKLSKGEAPVAGNMANGAKSAKPTAAEQKQAAQDEAVAKQKAIKEANDRAAALEKNIKDMQRLVELKNQSMAELQKNATQPAPATSAPAPVQATPPAPPAPPAPVAKPEAPVAKKAAPVTAPAEVPNPVPPKVDLTPESPLTQFTKWFDDINPVYAGAAAVIGLILILAGFMAKSRRRRESLSKFENSIMTNAEVKPNTVYGTQGGAAVNTNNTSFLTDFSQSGLGNLDTHDVDPIAEAEVYMAYGRDAQAEEILKEAMVKDPTRHEIKIKLLEIYAARNNLPAFESIATELYSALGGENTPLWQTAAELGRKLDPNNPLYGGSSTASSGNETAAIAAAAGAGIAALGLHAYESQEAAHEASPAVESYTPMQDDQDLDFNTAMDFDPVPAPAPASSSAPADEPVSDDMDDTLVMPDAPMLDISTMIDDHGEPYEEKPVAEPEEATADFSGMDFDLDFDAPELSTESTAKEAPTVTVDQGDHEDILNFDFDIGNSMAGDQEVTSHVAADTHEVSETPEETTVDEVSTDYNTPVAEAAAPALDFSGIDLDFGTSTPPLEEAPAEQAHTEVAELSEADQEIKTKLDLAQVYQEMGDFENAREILHEVLLEGNSDQQASAQSLLNQLG